MMKVSMERKAFIIAYQKIDNFKESKRRKKKKRKINSDHFNLDSDLKLNGINLSRRKILINRR